MVIEVLLSHLNSNLTTKKPPPIPLTVRLTCPFALNIYSSTNDSLPAAEAFSFNTAPSSGHP